MAGARPCTVFGGEESEEGGRKRARRKHAPMVVYLPLVKVRHHSHQRVLVLRLFQTDPMAW